MKLGQHFEANIEDLAFGGEAIIKIDNFVIFLKGAIPGQKVKAFLSKKKKNYGEAKIIEILKKSPLEIKSKCLHFGKCGGCKWQNIEYKTQLEFKEKQIKDCLKGIGKLENKNLNFQDICPSPSIFTYRNKVEFSFGYEKMSVKTDENGNKIFEDIGESLGFHKAGNWKEIVEIKNCELISENANNVFNLIKKWCLSKKDKKVYNPFSHKGYWRHLLIRENLKGEIMICLIVQTEEKKKKSGTKKIENNNDNEKKSKQIETKKDSVIVTSSLINYDDLIPKLKKFNVKSFFIAINNGLNDDWSDSKLELIYGNKSISEKILGLNFSISPKSFFQTNSLGAEKLYSTILDFVFENKNENNIILDLYCGTGTIGQIIAKREKENINKKDKSTLSKSNTKIIGIELIKSAIEDARLNAKLNNLNNIEFICGKVENLLPDIIEKYKEIDLIIIDPPRSGMHKKALETILDISAKEIVYVSCNPATFARDFTILKEKYDITKIKPVDMFPHTAHIEMIGKLTLKSQ